MGGSHSYVTLQFIPALYEVSSFEKVIFQKIKKSKRKIRTKQIQIEEF